MSKYKENRAKGLCGTCGKEPKANKALCQNCLNLKQATKLKRRQKGKCKNCNQPAIGQTFCCERCNYKNIARKRTGDVNRWEELKILMQSQNHQCPYLGLSIDVGNGTAHLDHIVPVSKGGSNKSSNLQFVSKWANLMKGTASDAEFREQLKTALPIIIKHST